MNNPYDQQIRAIASQMRESDAVLCDCDCYSLPVECLRNFKPEDYKAFADAARAYTEGCVTAKLYWGSHWKGRHILHIHHPVFGGASTSCAECRIRRAAVVKE